MRSDIWIRAGCLMATFADPEGNVVSTPADGAADTDWGGKLVILDEPPDGTRAQLEDFGQLADGEQFRKFPGVWMLVG